MIVDFPGRDPRLIRQGQRLSNARQARGVSLTDLAQDVGLEAGRLDAAERGRHRLTSCELHAVINALRLPLSTLFDDKIGQ